ncbi:tail fiber assembly protein [Neisseriaceae bacterium CLB008]
MKHFINVETTEVFGFESDGSQDMLITDDMIEMTKDQFLAYQQYPSKYHKFNVNTMQWEISKSAKVRLDEELADSDKDLALQRVATLRAECDRDILPLQDAVDLDEATPEEVERLKDLKRFRIALNRWEHPEEIPKLD